MRGHVSAATVAATACWRGRLTHAGHHPKQRELTAWLPPRMSMLPSGNVMTVGYQRRDDMVATWL